MIKNKVISIDYKDPAIVGFGMIIDYHIHEDATYSLTSIADAPIVEG
jgi:hypothetical protein